MTPPPIGWPVKFLRPLRVVGPLMRSRIGSVGTVVAVVRRNGGWAVDVRFAATGSDDLAADKLTLEQGEYEEVA